MADSDNTMSLPAVTRRKVLAGTAIAIVGSKGGGFVRNNPEADQAIDPAVSVWQKWRAAQDHTEWLCRQQQRMERKLIEDVGVPCSKILLRDGQSVTLHSLEAVRDVLDLGSEKVAVCATAETNLEAHQARWDAADREIGYSAALAAEREAADRADELLKLLSETPAASFAGVAAKLDAILREEQPSEGCSEFPWPQIRSARDDLTRISKEIAPEQAFPEEIRQQQHGCRPGESVFAVARGTDASVE